MWTLLKTTIVNFIDDEALSRGAAIAFYTVTSLAPVLLVVIAIAGLAFGQDAAKEAIFSQLNALMGRQAADVLQSALANASTKSSGILAAVIGVGTLALTASGMFGEMQSALNHIWKVQPSSETVSRLIRARAASLGLVAALGFLLAVSLVASAALTAGAGYLESRLPFGQIIFSILNFVVSILLLAILFAAIFKVLPDRPIAWRDVFIGAMITALLFTVGKSLIGWYLGSSAVSSSYGAAGGLIVLFFWVYYSTQIFLIGAEFTQAYAASRGGAAIPASTALKPRSNTQLDTIRRPVPAPSMQQAEANVAHHRAELVQAIANIQERLHPSAADNRRRRSFTVAQGKLVTTVIGVVAVYGFNRLLDRRQV